ncbi:myelin-oligodendrocyte glycoprotein-like isoform X5 [Dicentrarchus labrax]|uniref:myelin-oligodendrocyte glycoprotein-like isoform X5 n=1 Tax=Dicentrarchus labrax TaxID=13489 RepID=UPI0021F691D8|nr:myelin-oligodendrocyte glycoprotein-like isoform X5 [Dicentrarchus labrax]
MKSILLVLLSSVALNFTGNCDVIGSTQTVKVKVNDVAILPCFSTSNMTNAIVKWKQEQSNKKYVHFYRSGDDNVDDQDENFRGRTSLSRKEMSGGNVSLKLTNVTELDAGNYTCDARVETSPETVQHRKCNVTLIVEPEKDPVDRKQVRVKNKKEEDATDKETTKRRILTQVYTWEAPVTRVPEQVHSTRTSSQTSFLRNRLYIKHRSF